MYVEPKTKTTKGVKYLNLLNALKCSISVVISNNMLNIPYFTIMSIPIIPSKMAYGEATMNENNE